MEIRRIEDKDVEVVSNLIMRNFDEVMKNYHSIKIIEKYKSHNSPEKIRYQMMWKDILVVIDGNEIIATGAVANFGDINKPKYSVSNFFVKPELHRKGIGRILFNSLLKIAVDKGAKTFHVPSSRNGIAFYSKMGFVKDILQPEEADEITWMTKGL